MPSNGEHPSPRHKRGTPPGRISDVWNVVTPMKSVPKGSRSDREERHNSSSDRRAVGTGRPKKRKSASRKATGIHNRLDRAIPTLKGADVGLVDDPKDGRTDFEQGA